MCSRTDDPTQHDALTPAEADAFRAYMHGLNRQAAVFYGIDPDTICETCGETLPHEHKADE